MGETNLVDTLVLQQFPLSWAVREVMQADINGAFKTKGHLSDARLGNSPCPKIHVERLEYLECVETMSSSAPYTVATTLAT